MTITGNAQKEETDDLNSSSHYCLTLNQVQQLQYNRRRISGDKLM